MLKRAQHPSLRGNSMPITPLQTDGTGRCRGTGRSDDWREFFAGDQMLRANA
jgi:hypothetical protein